MPETLETFLSNAVTRTQTALTDPETWLQLGLVAVFWLVALGLSKLLRRLPARPEGATGHMLRNLAPLVAPLLVLLAMLIAMAASRALFGGDWIARLALLLAGLFLFERLIRVTAPGPIAKLMLRWVAMPLLALSLLGLLGPVNAALESMSVNLGNLRLSVATLLRSLIFGGLLFWLGWVSNSAGQNVIRRQEALDVRAREVVAKLYQIGLMVLVALLFLQIMGISLTALAVFGGAVGVGVGFGLQTIASNYISGLIILFDRSLAVGDYIETEGGLAGHVRSLNMRYTTLESFDGKMVLVPNEKFVGEPFNNWSHKDQKQRYDVNFSLPYDTDIRRVCELVREAVATHPQVISGEGVPIEEQPDCEIESFADSGVTMLVEFWIEGIDDGRNRVGADLMLLIFETLREHGVFMPFPQREVRILNDAIATRAGS
jgi:small-conductance mechanosensitive channel